MSTFVTTAVVVAVVAVVVTPAFAAAFDPITGRNPKRPGKERDNWKQEDQENWSEIRRR